jgi:hypothetical protein
MYKCAGAACITAALTCGVAVAEELRPIQAKSISLGDVSGVAYYTVEENGFAVVATLASGETATPIRFIATLLPSQKAVISVPREIGQTALTVEFIRDGDRMIVGPAKKLASAEVSRP